MHDHSTALELAALHGMLRRIAVLVILLVVEALVASLFLDGATLRGKGGLLSALVAMTGAWAVRAVIGAAALFATFAYLKHRSILLRIAREAATVPIDGRLLALHALAMVIFAASSAVLYGPGVGWTPVDVVAVVWLLAAMAAVGSASLALMPAQLWADLLSSTGLLWLQAIVGSTAACVAGAMSWGLWAATTRLTYALVKLLLSPFFAEMVVQPERMRIGTSRFTVIISPECSGLEGAMLLAVFAVVWLILFRHEVRFPQSLILIPAGVLLLFLLNAVRIAALVFIGNAGAREIAIGGFHSQAGWIAFNFVAFGLAIAARRVPWFSVHPPEPQADTDRTDNPTAIYLMPFLAIVAAAMASQAMSGGFEWLYGLRVAAAMAALWWYRHDYRSMDWSFGWLGVAIGVVVFGLWIAMEPSAKPGGMPAALARTSGGVQMCWIALRTLGAVLAVPVAEELAFRGFILRRLVAVVFETVRYRQVGAVAVVVSSVLFGLMHGERWVAGSVAGALYAGAAIRGGRLGDAVAAHAITNGLLACYVLATGSWQLW